MSAVLSTCQEPGLSRLALDALCDAALVYAEVVRQDGTGSRASLARAHLAQAARRFGAITTRAFAELVAMLDDGWDADTEVPQ